MTSGQRTRTTWRRCGGSSRRKAESGPTEKRFLDHAATTRSPVPDRLAGGAVSRFLCEHLLDEIEIIAACISPIHAQDPVVTNGNLSHSLLQDAAGGVDVAVMVCPALRTAPLPLIEPQLIDHVPAMRARLARREPLGDFQNRPTRRIALVEELAADLAERGIGSCPRTWCTSRELRFGWTRAQLTTADNRAG